MSEPTPSGDSRRAPSDPTPSTPDALEYLLSEIDHEAFVAFVADLRARAGRNVTREGSRLTVTRPDGDHERVLVWTDHRNRLERLWGADPEVPDAGPVDIVVTRERDVETATAVAEEYGASVVDTAAIHDRLLYAIDRESCRALCATHFDRPVTPWADPDVGSRIGENDPVTASPTRSRALIAGVALLALAVAGAAGLPGGPLGTLDGGPDTDPADPAGVTPTGVQGSPDVSGPTPTAGSTPSPEPNDDPDPPASTPEPEECPACSSLLSFGDEPPIVAANETTTITGSLYNPYPFALDDVAIELRSGDGNLTWTVTRAGDAGVGALDPGESRSVAWNVTAMPGLRGNYTLDAVSVYADGRTTVRTTRTYALRIVAPGLLPPEEPPCTEALGPLIGGGSCHLLTLDDDRPELAAGTTTTVSGTLYNPREYDLVNGSVTLEAPGENWTVTPVNGTTFERLPPGAVRHASWNMTPPVTASGAYTLTSNTTYTRTGGPGRANRSAPHGYRVSVARAEATRPPDTIPCHLDSGPVNAFGPCYLLTFPGDPPEVTPGTTTTVTGRLYNPREYDLVNGSVTLEAPGENWTVTPVRGTTFDELEPGEVQVAQWNLTVPASAGGTVELWGGGTIELRGVTNYTRLGGPGDANVSLTRRYPVAVATSEASGPNVANNTTDAVPSVVRRPASSLRVAP